MTTEKVSGDCRADPRSAPDVSGVVSNRLIGSGREVYRAGPVHTAGEAVHLDVLLSYRSRIEIPATVALGGRGSHASSFARIRREEEERAGKGIRIAARHDQPILAATYQFRVTARVARDE